MRRRWLAGRGPDLLLILSVLGFAALLVLFVGRGPDTPSIAPGDLPLAQSGREIADAPEEAPRGARAALPDPRPAPSGAERPPGAARESAEPTGSAREPSPPQPTSGTLRIRGRVLDRAGEPVPDIRIALRSAVGSDGPPGSAVRSQADGRFEIGGLAPGDYRLSTAETTIHRSHSMVVRGGSEGVDIILDRRQALRVYGQVTDPEGAPLAGARVEPLGNPAGGVSTDDDGHYELILESTLSLGTVGLRFSADGHRELQQRASLADLPPDGLRQDARLALARGFAVTGRIRAPGRPNPPGSKVQIRSQRRSAHRETSTDAEGRFRFEHVEAGDDWIVLVRPSKGFADATLGPLRLAANGDELEITLEPLDSGSLEGRMLRPDGRPLPNFEFFVHSNSALGRSLSVASDAQGHFLAEEVPSGNLQLQSRGTPSHRITGLRLEPGARERVDLVADVGDLDLAGRVLGSDGRPLPGAEIRLSWRHHAGGLVSSSFRRTVSDTEGAFRFAQLGRGPHQIDVRADGHARARQQVSPGNQKLELRLRGGP